MILATNLVFFLYPLPVARLCIKLAHGVGMPEAVAGRSEEQISKSVRRSTVLTSVTACVVLLLL